MSSDWSMRDHFPAVVRNRQRYAACALSRGTMKRQTNGERVQRRLPASMTDGALFQYKLFLELDETTAAKCGVPQSR